APVLGVADIASAAHTRHREMVLERGGYRGTGFPAKLRRTPAQLDRLPPRLGEHTREVLLEAGYAPDAIAALARSGAFGPTRTTETAAAP
ncbi:MAG: CoA transferase, partial [Cupriavidus necator]